MGMSCQGPGMTLLCGYHPKILNVHKEQMGDQLLRDLVPKTPPSRGAGDQPWLPLKEEMAELMLPLSHLLWGTQDMQKHGWAGRGCWWEQNTTVLGIYEDKRLPGIRDHRTQGWMRGRESLYCFLSYIVSIKYLLLLLLFTAFRFSLWMCLMLYLANHCPCKKSDRLGKYSLAFSPLQSTHLTDTKGLIFSLGALASGGNEF